MKSKIKPKSKSLNSASDHFDPLTNYRVQAEIIEEQTLYPRASFSKKHSRYFGAENDHRLPYKRDVDRILHSKAYARYSDKTQVAYLVNNDHITYRGLHVQLVSHFAKGIAQILRLNTDLVEAISLGHDVGHPPFAHEGEKYLSKLSEEYGNGHFTHSWQSCRLFTSIEPLNLGLEVYDGFLCHDGGLGGPKLEPRFGKSWDDHFHELSQKKMEPEKNIMPGTLEGCLVKICDTISYLGRDIEDAITLGFLKREQVPKTILGTTNRDILNTMARDIITHSYGKDYIQLSDEAFTALKTIRSFNFKEIYFYPKLKLESKRVERGYRALFEYLLGDLNEQEKQSYIWQHYLHNKTEKYLKESTPVQKVVDYISGMTDNFFVRTLEKLIIPKQIEL
jgi:dGTPase